MLVLRWLLIIPVAILGWYLVFIIGMGLLGLAEGLCSEPEMVSGRCEAPWYLKTKDVVIVALAGLSAVIVVIVAYLLAPVRKITSAVVAFLLGSAVATYVVIETGSWQEYVAAIVFGLLVTLWIARKHVFSRSK